MREKERKTGEEREIELCVRESKTDGRDTARGTHAEPLKR